MNREEAIELLEDLNGAIEDNQGRDYDEAFHMAIEALQFVEHFDLLKEFQSLQEVVRCKDCIHYESDGGAFMVCRIDDMVVDKTDYCSYGERKGGDDE